MAPSTEQKGPKRAESDVYDRQIRLWGAEAQAKISKSRVLYIHLTLVSQEILKNLVLAGVRAVLCDARSYPEAVLDTPSFFFPKETTPPSDKKIRYASVGHACQAAIEELNPLLGDCTVLDKTVEQLVADNDTTLSEFDIVVCSRVGMKDASMLASKCKGKFYLVDCFGWNGAAIVDLGETPHQFRVEKGKEMSEIQTMNQRVTLEDVWKVPLSQKIGNARQDRKHPPLVWLQYRCILEYHAQTNKWPSDTDKFVSTVSAFVESQAPNLLGTVLTDDILKHWATTATAQISPVCAVLGGVMGNEVIKAISGKGEPANNAIVLDGMEGKCRNLWIDPQK